MPDPIRDQGLAGTAGAGLAPQPSAVPPEPPGVPADPEAAELEEFGTEARSQFRMVLRRFLRHKLAMVSLVVLVITTLLSFLAPYYYKYSYDQQTPATSEAPSTTHWFGTQQLGKDVYAQVMRGATKSILIGLVAAVVATVLGVAIGALAGYYRGWLDNVLMRVTDLFLMLPLIAILIVLANRFDSFLGIALLIAFFVWMYQARITRSEFLSLREREFVLAARALGGSDRRIMMRHLVPNAIGSIIVNATLTVAVAILTEATLAFLGFGLEIPDVSLGSLVAQGTGAARTRPWMFYFPGMWLVLILLCVNFLGDGLRDAIDPTQDRVRA